MQNSKNNDSNKPKFPMRLIAPEDLDARLFKKLLRIMGISGTELSEKAGKSGSWIRNAVSEGRFSMKMVEVAKNSTNEKFFNTCLKRLTKLTAAEGRNNLQLVGLLDEAYLKIDDLEEEIEVLKEKLRLSKKIKN